MIYIMITACILVGALAVWISAACADPRLLRQTGWAFTVLGAAGVIGVTVTAAVFLTRSDIISEERTLFSLLLWPSVAILVLCLFVSFGVSFAGKRAISSFAAAVPVVWTFPLLLLSHVCAQLSAHGNAMSALGCFLSLVLFLGPGAALLRGAVMYGKPEVAAAHRQALQEKQKKREQRRALRKKKQKLRQNGRGRKGDNA